MNKSKWQSKYYFLNEVDGKIHVGISLQEIFERDSLNFRPGSIEALRQLALMLDAGAPAEKVLGQLAWVVRAKFPQLAPAGVRPAVDALFRTDVDLKRSAGDPRILLERLVVELCEAKEPSRAMRAAW